MRFLGKTTNPARFLLQIGLILAAVLFLFQAALALVSPGQFLNLRDQAPVELSPLELTEIREQVDPSGSTLCFYRASCPEVLQEDASLCISLAHQYAAVWLDEEQVYLSAEPASWHLGRSPGYYWAMIPLRLTDAGREIRLEIRDVYPELEVKAPLVTVARQTELLLRLLALRWPRLLACLLCILVGLIYALVSMLPRFWIQERWQLVYLGLVTFCYGMYRFSELSVLVMLVSVSRYSLFSPRSLHEVSMVCYLVLPLLLARFFAWDRHGKPVYQWVSAALAAEVLCLSLLQLTGLRDLLQCMSLLHWVAVATVVALLGLSVASILREGPDREPIRLVYILMVVILLVHLGLQQFAGLRPAWDPVLILVLVHGLVRGILSIRRSLSRREELLRVRAQLADQRSALLASQIKPHFIYNTLNCIDTLCEVDPAQAREAIYLLCRYLQCNSQALEQTKPIPLEQELAHTRFYLNVEQLRFPDSFTVEWDIRCPDIRLPALTLQPLAENAVRHGLRKKEGPGRLVISTDRIDREWILRVEDDGVGFDPDAPLPRDGRPHIGLNNLRSRLALVHGTLELNSSPGRGTTATIRLPIEKGNKL